MRWMTRRATPARPQSEYPILLQNIPLPTCQVLSAGCRKSNDNEHRPGADGRGRAVQVEPMKRSLTAPGTERLILKYDDLLSNCAFNIDLRRYTGVLEGLDASLQRGVPIALSLSTDRLDFGPAFALRYPYRVYALAAPDPDTGVPRMFRVRPAI